MILNFFELDLNLQWSAEMRGSEIMSVPAFLIELRFVKHWPLFVSTMKQKEICRSPAFMHVAVEFQFSF